MAGVRDGFYKRSETVVTLKRDIIFLLLRQPEQREKDWNGHV